MLSRSQIIELFRELDKKLVNKGVSGELYLLGGAVMCLAFNARASTKDIDAFFSPTSTIRELAKELAIDKSLAEDWLNDAVKGFLSEKGDYDQFLSLEALKVYVAKPEYLLAMKCLSMRIGEEFHDEGDVRFLLRYLNITEYNNALSIITRYYPTEMFPQKTMYALEEILSEEGHGH
jgi:hypothetical protein